MIIIFEKAETTALVTICLTSRRCLVVLAVRFSPYIFWCDRGYSIYQKLIPD